MLRFLSCSIYTLISSTDISIFFEEVPTTQMAIARTAAQESVGGMVSIPGKRNATGGTKI